MEKTQQKTDNRKTAQGRKEYVPPRLVPLFATDENQPDGLIEAKYGQISFVSSLNVVKD